MKSLEELWSKGKTFLGTKYSILGGAMSWVSDSDLVAAVSNAGGFGVLAAGSMTPELLEQEIINTHAKTQFPFAVNLIVMHPDLDKLLDKCIQQKVSHVIFAGGIPSATIIKQARDHQIKILTFAPNLALAKRMVKNGVDALIIEGSEAGGHIGPVSTSILAQEILPHIHEVPVFVAGGIGSGDIMVEYLNMGASGVQIGTLLVCSEESNAHDNFKVAFLKAKARDAQPTLQIDPEFPIIPVRALHNQSMKDFAVYQQQVIAKYKNAELSKSEAQLQIEHYWAGALRRAVVDGDVEHGSLMCGQSIGFVNEILPVVNILDNLVSRANKLISLN